MAQLGERFLLYRVDVADPAAQARSSLAHHGRERAMRQELGEAVAGLFAGIELTRRRRRLAPPTPTGWSRSPRSSPAPARPSSATRTGASSSSSPTAKRPAGSSARSPGCSPACG